eukprot:jgi/Mesvir1/16682/Mv15081-RA.1
MERRSPNIKDLDVQAEHAFPEEGTWSSEKRPAESLHAPVASASVSSPINTTDHEPFSQPPLQPATPEDGSRACRSEDDPGNGSLIPPERQVAKYDDDATPGKPKGDPVQASLEDVQAVDHGAKYEEEDASDDMQDTMDAHEDGDDTQELPVADGCAPQPEKAKGSYVRKPNEEDVCFICKDGGDLVVCDRRLCPKSYHLSCIGRDDSFLNEKGRWSCGWHFCMGCSDEHHTVVVRCLTCPAALCKECMDAHPFDLQPDNPKSGLCADCVVMVRMLEGLDACEADLTDETTWEGLFKLYWDEMKADMGLSYPFKHMTGKPDVALLAAAGRASKATKKKSPAKSPKGGRAGRLKKVREVLGEEEEGEGSDGEDEAVAGIDDDEMASEADDLAGLQDEGEEEEEEGGREGGGGGRKRERSSAVIDKEEADEVGWLPQVAPFDGWASPALKAVLEAGGADVSAPMHRFVMQKPLWNYIRKNNLQHPRHKNRIVCDDLLRAVFQKKVVGQMEMQKYLGVHLAKGSQAGLRKPQGGGAGQHGGHGGHFHKAHGGHFKDKGVREGDLIPHGLKGGPKGVARRDSGDLAPVVPSGPQYAAICRANLALIFLKRFNVEGIFMGKSTVPEAALVDAIVRIRLKTDGEPIYRLVTVTAVTERPNEYEFVAGYFTRKVLQLNNLGKIEDYHVNELSNSDFNEDEVRRLKQAVRVGIHKRFLVNEWEDKAMELATERVEALRAKLSNLRNRANLNGDLKQLKECVNQLRDLDDKDKAKALVMTPIVVDQSDGEEDDDEDPGAGGRQDDRGVGANGKGKGSTAAKEGGVNGDRGGAADRRGPELARDDRGGAKEGGAGGREGRSHGMDVAKGWKGDDDRDRGRRGGRRPREWEEAEEPSRRRRENGWDKGPRGGDGRGDAPVWGSNKGGPMEEGSGWGGEERDGANGAAGGGPVWASGAGTNEGHRGGWSAANEGAGPGGMPGALPLRSRPMQGEMLPTQPQAATALPGPGSNAGGPMQGGNEVGWMYRDPKGVVQGPFPLFKLRGWQLKGFFQGTELLVWQQNVTERDAVPLVSLLEQEASGVMAGPGPGMPGANAGAGMAAGGTPMSGGSWQEPRVDGMASAPVQMAPPLTDHAISNAPVGGAGRGGDMGPRDILPYGGPHAGNPSMAGYGGMPGGHAGARPGMGPGMGAGAGPQFYGRSDFGAGNGGPPTGGGVAPAGWNAGPAPAPAPGRMGAGWGAQQGAWAQQAPQPPQGQAPSWMAGGGGGVANVPPAWSSGARAPGGQGPVGWGNTAGPAGGTPASGGWLATPGNPLWE